MSSVSHGSAMTVDQPVHERPLAQPRRRSHGLAGHFGRVVLEQLAQFAVEDVGRHADDARGFDPRAQPGVAPFGHHALQHQLRRLDVLRPALAATGTR